MVQTVTEPSCRACRPVGPQNGRVAPDPSFAPTQLAARAAYLLRGNDLGAMTTAAPLLYPHMWSWDAAFVAVGLAPLSVERAVVELDTLLSAQWGNGMIPHIVFANGVTTVTLTTAQLVIAKNLTIQGSGVGGVTITRSTFSGNTASQEGGGLLFAYGDPVTISLGFACTVPSRVAAPTDLIRAADQALYQAKQDGRNRAKQAGVLTLVHHTHKD